MFENLSTACTPSPMCC